MISTIDVKPQHRASMSDPQHLYAPHHDGVVRKSVDRIAWKQRHFACAAAAMAVNFGFGLLPFWRIAHFSSAEARLDYSKAHGLLYGPVYLGTAIPARIFAMEKFAVYSSSACPYQRTECVAITVGQVFFAVSAVLSVAAVLAATRRSRRAALFGIVCSAWAAIACTVVWTLHLLSSVHLEYTKVDAMCKSLPDRAVGALLPEVFAGAPGRCAFTSTFVCVWFAALATILHATTAVLVSWRFSALTRPAAAAHDDDRDVKLTALDEQDR